MENKKIKRIFVECEDGTVKAFNKAILITEEPKDELHNIFGMHFLRVNRLDIMRMMTEANKEVNDKVIDELIKYIKKGY